MGDKGIEIVVALLEKREYVLVTKESAQGFVQELERAVTFGYAQKEDKGGRYTLTEKGRKLVLSGYNFKALNQPDSGKTLSRPRVLPATPLPEGNKDNSQQRQLRVLLWLKGALILLALLIFWFLAVQLSMLRST